MAFHALTFGHCMPALGRLGSSLHSCHPLGDTYYTRYRLCPQVCAYSEFACTLALRVTLWVTRAALATGFARRFVYAAGSLAYARSLRPFCFAYTHAWVSHACIFCAAGDDHCVTLPSGRANMPFRFQAGFASSSSF